MGGLTLGDHLQVPGSALERRDCGASQGPWSIVIRASTSQFGVHGAVVTFPVDLTEPGTPVPKPEGAAWSPGVQRLVWPISSSRAKIVGDVGQSALANLALRVTIKGGKPQLAELDGFRVTATIPYHSTVVHEMRYSSKDLGQESTLGDGLVLTGITWGGSFESLAFESRARPAGFVRGKPAVFSEALGGNGALAWESGPGQVTYIGYSGSVSNADAIKTLRALADKGRVLTPAQWQTKDSPSVGDQSG